MRMRWWLFPIFVALAGLAPLECQAQATQSNKVSYEGQRVAAVDLVANPKISVDSLRPLVQQRSGEAYSNSKVEGTISALKPVHQGGGRRQARSRRAASDLHAGAHTLLRSLPVSRSHEKVHLHTPVAGHRYPKPDAVQTGGCCQGWWGPSRISYLSGLLPSSGSNRAPV